MAIIILPDAQQDLLSLQEYMLDHWSETDWLNAENEIFEKLALVDTGWSIAVSMMMSTWMPWQGIGKITRPS